MKILVITIVALLVVAVTVTLTRKFKKIWNRNVGLCDQENEQVSKQFSLTASNEEDY